MKRRALQFGYELAVPPHATTAWGARLIFPDDLLPDRQSFTNRDTPAGEKLAGWLNGGGALKKALKRAAVAAQHGEIEPSSSEDITLLADWTGCIIANPRRSFGYLYVAAFLTFACETTIREEWLVKVLQPGARVRWKSETSGRVLEGIVDHYGKSVKSRWHVFHVRDAEARIVELHPERVLDDVPPGGEIQNLTKFADQ